MLDTTSGLQNAGRSSKHSDLLGWSERIGGVVDSMYLIRNMNIVLRTIHGSIFLIDISDNYAGDKCSLYEINNTGRFLWDRIDECGTIENLVDALQDAIIDEVPRDLILTDVTEYINDLIDKQFVLEVVCNG